MLEQDTNRLDVSIEISFGYKNVFDNTICSSKLCAMISSETFAGI